MFVVACVPGRGYLGPETIIADCPPDAGGGPDFVPAHDHHAMTDLVREPGVRDVDVWRGTAAAFGRVGAAGWAGVSVCSDSREQWVGSDAHVDNAYEGRSGFELRSFRGRLVSGGKEG